MAKVTAMRTKPQESRARAKARGRVRRHALFLPKMADYSLVAKTKMNSSNSRMMMTMMMTKTMRRKRTKMVSKRNTRMKILRRLISLRLLRLTTMNRKAKWLTSA